MNCGCQVLVEGSRRCEEFAIANNAMGVPLCRGHVERELKRLKRLEDLDEAAFRFLADYRRFGSRLPK